MSRLPPLDYDNLAPEQQRSLGALRTSASNALSTPVGQRMFETVRSLARRGIAVGPTQAWLRSPSLFDSLQPLLAHREPTGLPGDVAEPAIVLTGRHGKSQFEFWVHAPMAREAGLPADAIEAIRTGATPQLDRPDLRVAYDVVTEHFATNRVSNATYSRAIEILGGRGLIDLIGIVGFYCLVSMTLNVIESGVPPGEVEPFA